MKLTVIGIGLIGGSFSLALQKKKLVSRVYGVDSNLTHQQRALELGLVHEILPLKEAVAQSDIILVAVPVDATVKLLPEILDLSDKQIVFDVGSTKASVLEAVSSHKNRKRFVATHPMWGTEHSGPDAAVQNAFHNKAVVICDAEESDTEAVNQIEYLYKKLGMHIVRMNGVDHDTHVAYVSHISHITSFALASTVLEKEREEDTIFELASGGFESTVRLAKSNADMWIPIFQQNRENVLDVLNEHISQLRKFKSCLEKENWTYLRELIAEANQIRKILDRKGAGEFR
jgi:prephenate dehydrogenase